MNEIGLDHSGVVVDETELKSVNHFLPFAPGRDTILRIHVKNFQITQKYGNETDTNPYIHSLNIYYSENAGQVVEILSDLPRGVKLDDPFPPVREQEKALKYQGQSYAWTQLAAPQTKLMKAFDAAIRIMAAKQILVYYTLGSENHSKTKNQPIWEIYQRGLPSSPMIGGMQSKVDISSLPQDNYTTTVNAITGKGESEGTSTF
ncbi:MAG TPA: hypothetical protein VG733_18720 [Chthoniobacteraceae bacterium]|nr:hypothetical protein [Chthoniobacteraceae bacterium]